jgi:CheY-like chemotaxis protein
MEPAAVPERKLRILLVEDSPELGELITMALTDQGFEVCHAWTAEEALSGLGSALTPLPDVIVFDLRLPGMGGSDFSRALHANPEWRRIPRVAMTGKSLLPHEEIALGVQEIFQKPLDILTLFAGLRRLATAGAAPAPAA